MPYYPLSQIKTNLFSNGNLVTAESSPYTGYYWQNSKGNFFSGKTPQDSPSQQLFLSLTKPLPNQPSEDTLTSLNQIALFPSDADPFIAPEYRETSNILNEYNNFKPFLSNSFLPVFNPMIPTQQDYQIGEFRRYFCKKTNELIYIEINEKTFDLLIIKDPQILWSLYFPFNIPWTLTGDKQKVAQTNRNIVLLTQTRLNLSKFNLYLKEDYLKYYQ